MTLEQLKKKNREKLNNCEGFSCIEPDELDQITTTSYQAGKKAGIDTAVEKLKQNVVGKFGVEQMIALDDTIKELQDKK